MDRLGSVPLSASLARVERRNKSFRAPLDSVVEKAREFEPQGEFSTAPATPARPGDGIPLGGNYRPPFGNHRDTNPGQTKNIKKQKK